ncbi:hypothetical protein ACJX0J_001537 [Zea mays]
MDSSLYLLMKERAPVGAHLRLNRVITQQVRRAFDHQLKDKKFSIVFLKNMSIFSVLIYLFKEVWYACDNNDKIFLILIKRRRIKSIEILLIQKGEIFVIVLSTGATERYVKFDWILKKITISGGDRLKRFQIEKLQSFRFVRGDKKRGTIYL